ncbi:hypothetical protein STEG23_021190 [Scotinomys teguina]
MQGPSALSSGPYAISHLSPLQMFQITVVPDSAANRSFFDERTWKQPRCPSTEEWIRKMWYIYAMEYYAAEKNNDIMKFAGKWMELENVILSEDQDCSLKIRELDVPTPWFLDPGGWSKTAAVSLYFVFPGICILSLLSLGVHEFLRPPC